MQTSWSTTLNYFCLDNNYVGKLGLVIFRVRINMYSPQKNYEICPSKYVFFFFFINLTRDYKGHWDYICIN